MFKAARLSAGVTVASSPSTSSSTKVVHLVRHAQGEHNVAGEEDYSYYQDEAYADAALTDKGVKQCQSLASIHEITTAELLVVSPMTRTLQTATISFPSLVGKCPWLALESVREQSGFHPCDRRRPVSEYKTEFQHVDFGLVGDDEDPLYHLHAGEREPDMHVAERSSQFFAWLRQRPEKEIVVVTHSAFLRHTFSNVLDAEEDDNTQFANCELRSYVVDL
jgi:broad specificity phosphatase PhoE